MGIRYPAGLLLFFGWKAAQAALDGPCPCVYEQDSLNAEGIMLDMFESLGGAEKASGEENLTVILSICG